MLFQITEKSYLSEFSATSSILRHGCSKLVQNRSHLGARDDRNNHTIFKQVHKYSKLHEKFMSSHFSYVEAV